MEAANWLKDARFKISLKWHWTIESANRLQKEINQLQSIGVSESIGEGLLDIFIWPVDGPTNFAMIHLMEDGFGNFGTPLDCNWAAWVAT